MELPSQAASAFRLADFIARGTRLGRYRLIRKLAVGGMAEVFLAQASGIEGFEKHVVLKRMLPVYASHPGFVHMFLDEARLAASLHHPNICQVFDIGSQVGNFYFAMEYIHGKDVRQILKRSHRTRHLPFGAAVSIAVGACAGLHYAHTKHDDHGNPLGIVHRDVSPSNLLVTHDGFVKVVDFGVAKLTARDEATRVESIKGKVAYMSPEQCQGKPLDRRSDIFSLGIVLWELTCGRRLFKGQTDLEIFQSIVHEDAPSPCTRRADYPPELARIVNKCLARNRDDRYATTQEVQRDLESFARDERLECSSLALAELMAELFPEDSAPPALMPARKLASGTDAPALPGDQPSARPDTELRQWVMASSDADAPTVTAIAEFEPDGPSFAAEPRVQGPRIPTWALHPASLVGLGALLSIVVGTMAALLL